jgi:hypothetical protein
LIDDKKTKTGTSPGRWVVVVLIILAASWGLWSIFATDGEESVEVAPVVEPMREVTAVEVRASDRVPTLHDYDAGSSDEEDYEIEDWEIPLPSPKVYFEPGKVEMDRDEVREAMMPVVEYMVTTPTALAWVQAYYVFRRASPGKVYLPAEPDELIEQEREIAQRRADAIRDVLLTEGIPEDRIKVYIRESSPHRETQRVQVRIIPRLDR